MHPRLFRRATEHPGGQSRRLPGGVGLYGAPLLHPKVRQTTASLTANLLKVARATPNPGDRSRFDESHGARRGAARPLRASAGRRDAVRSADAATGCLLRSALDNQAGLGAGRAGRCRPDRASRRRRRSGAVGAAPAKETACPKRPTEGPECGRPPTPPSRRRTIPRAYPRFRTSRGVSRHLVLPRLPPSVRAISHTVATTARTRPPAIKPIVPMCHHLPSIPRWKWNRNF